MSGVNKQRKVGGHGGGGETEMVCMVGGWTRIVTGFQPLFGTAHLTDAYSTQASQTSAAQRSFERQIKTKAELIPGWWWYRLHARDS